MSTETVPTTRSMLTLSEALDEAAADEMRRCAEIFVMCTNPPAALVDEFGTDRVRRTPISESAMTGMAVGAAGSGLRPLVMWRMVTFSFVAFDQVINQAAKIRYMFGGQRSFPIVFRTNYANGSRTAAQHSQTGYAFYAHAAGLKIIAPSSPADAKGLMTSALRDNDPVIVFEANRLSAAAQEVPEGEHVVPLGVGEIKRSGTDVTVVAIAYMVPLALQVAEELEAEGLSVEVVDPRTLVPLDIDLIRESVQRTGRLVVVDESHPTCSMASEIVAGVVEHAPSMAALRAAVERVCSEPVPVPYSPPLEDFVLPGTDRIREAVLRVSKA